MKRLFLAIPLPDSIKNYIRDFIPEQFIKGVKWTSPENLHLTLYFIGETKQEEIPGIVSNIRSVVKKHASFDLDFKEVLLKKKQGNPAMVWMEFYLCDAFAALARNVAAVFDDELKAPRPHITLARIKKSNIDEGSLMRNKQSTDQQEMTLPVNEVQLWESERKPAGSVYHLLEKFSLRS